MLRQVRGDLSKRIVKIIGGLRHIDGATGLRGKFLHASLGGQRAQVGVLVKTGLHDVNLAIVRQCALQGGVEIRAAGGVYAIRNNHDDPAARIRVQIRAGRNDPVE